MRTRRRALLIAAALLPLVLPQIAVASDSGPPPIRVAYVAEDDTTLDPVAYPLLGGVSDFFVLAGFKEMQALVAWTNAHGGVGGRPIALTHYASNKFTATTQGAADLCHQMVDVDHNEVVIDSMLMTTDERQACVPDKKAVLIRIGPDTDTAHLRGLEPYFASSGAAVDRQLAVIPDSLDQAGYFAGAHVGFVLGDTPALRHAYTSGIAPAMKRLKVYPEVAFIDEAFDFAADGPAQQPMVAQTVSSWALAGVDHVVMAASPQTLLTFANYATATNYAPRYAFTDYKAMVLDSGLLLQPRQLVGALAVSSTEGTFGVADDNTRTNNASSSSPVDRAAVSPGERRCRDTLGEARGMDYYDPGNSATDNSGVETMICDTFFLWLDSARQIGATWSAETFADGLRALGSSYASSLAHATDFSHRPDGASDYRVGQYDAACRCYVRLTPWLPLP